ncbi:hypothetical protein ALC57_07274, partial [Trachymyrmex cornetzi]
VRPKLGRSVYNLQTRERALPHRSGLPQLQCAPFPEAESSHRIVVVLQTGVSNYSVPSGDAAVRFVAAKGDGRLGCFLNVTEFVPSASGGVHVVRDIRQCRDKKLQLAPFTLFSKCPRKSERERERERETGSLVGLKGIVEDEGGIVLGERTPRSVINTVAVRLRRQWVELSRGKKSTLSKKSEKRGKEGMQ